MFDRVTVRAGPSHVSVTKTVHEHRAPTDESVRLLNEMQEKAVQNVIRSAVLVGDGIEVAYIERHSDVDGFGSVIHLSFKFNGKIEIVRCEIDQMKADSMRGNDGEFCDFIVKEISSVIMKRIFAKLMRAAVGK